jgi:hypothetical protein
MVDNDGDGLVDAEDPDCAEMRCDDGIDNNSNGFADCDDSDCQTYWPICVHQLALAAIMPQAKCQGSLVYHPDRSVVECSQPGGVFKHDFFNYPLAVNSSDRTIEGLDLTRGPGYQMEDTMINCAEFEVADFGQHKVLKVGNDQSVPEKGYRMLQKYPVRDEDVTFLSGARIEAVYVFVKGMGFGGGNASVYPAFSGWNETNTSCYRYPDSEQLFDSSCDHIAPSSASNEYGWSLVNITQIFLCQVISNAEPYLNLLWVQQAGQTRPQVWHSSESPYPPQIVVYYS